jgi:hypothetical protein
LRDTWLRPWFVVLGMAACSRGTPPFQDSGTGSQDSGTGSQDSGTGSQDAAGQPPTLELLAGDIGGPGNGDGDGTAARFAFPRGVAVDAAGNLYVADTGNDTSR